MPYKDPERQREASRLHYQNNKERKFKQSREWKKKRKEWLDDYKRNHPCVKCGESRIACLEFHHPEPVNNGNGRGKRRPEAIHNIATSKSMYKVLEALKKVIVLCANCHKIEHWDKENNNFSLLHKENT